MTEPPEPQPREPQPTAEAASPEAAASNKEHRKPGLRRRFERGSQTFQPALWSRLIVVGVAAVYALLFVVLNTRKVRIDFVFVSTRASLIWVILLCLGVGVVLGVLLSQLHRHRMRKRESR
jgi:uncharacterized integral membrane protein